MTLSRINIALAVSLLVVASLCALIGVDSTIPNVEFLPDMKYSPAYGAFSRNPNFANGRTLQPPVEDTIARGQLPVLNYAATPADAVRAGKEIPNTIDPQGKQAEFTKQRGAELYAAFCVSCHGAKGGGDGPVVQPPFPVPPPLTTGKSTKMKDGQLFHILTYGQGSMASFAAQLNLEDRWHVINHVRAIQQSHAEGQKTSEDLDLSF
ncbi:MAG: c-type cytochrome [Planctomycetota bacterium]|nr:c-type cytochrome [Planctomycetota bacterium]